MKRPLRIFVSLAIPVVVLDQLSKGWIRGNLAERGHIDVVEGMFRIWHRTNTGGAWSILGDQAWGMPVLIAVSTLAVAGMIWLATQLRREDIASAVGLGFMGGGALGNLVDRVRFRQVTDFLDVYQAEGPLAGLFELVAGGPHFPTFNVADMGIVCGGILLAITSFRRPVGTAEIEDDATSEPDSSPEESLLAQHPSQLPPVPGVGLPPRVDVVDSRQPGSRQRA
ncbi:MAG: signal peptidase II [Deltaproteobacteria bacterium]|nr:signal peptidase II [Deltaproteobacteria bacterium]